MNKIKIGWSEVSLVPEGRKINLAGQFYERITDEVESPITVTAIAIECGTDSMIFCSCDLGGTSHMVLCRVREILSKYEGFPTEKVIVSATHVHTALSFANFSDTVGGASLDVLAKLMPDVKYEELVSYNGDDLLDGEEAFEFVTERIAKAAKQAWDSRKNGMFAQGFGRAAVGLCRRVCYSDGSAKMWGDTDTATFTELEGGNDSGIELLFTFDTDKKLTGVIANIACPSQVLEHRNFISADYWGKIKENIRREYGDNIFLLGLCSPAGDQCPRDMIRWVQPETPIDDPNIVRGEVTKRVADPSMFDLKGCTLIGRRVANEIFYALENVSEYVSETVLEHRNLTVDMPLRRVTPEETAEAVKAIKDFAAEIGDRAINFADNARMHVYAGTIARSEAQETIDIVPVEIHIIRLGDIAFATNPYELFLDYGNRMRARSKASQTFLVQLACGCFGYLPTEKAEKGSHYSAYISSGTSGHEGGELLVRKTVQEINDMFK